MVLFSQKLKRVRAFCWGPVKTATRNKSGTIGTWYTLFINDFYCD